jgi:predicted phage terminase large subunit-like protein
VQGVANEKNLVRNEDRTPSERRRNASKAGKASGEARRKQRDMREAAKVLMSMQVVGDNNKKNLANFGVAEEDQNYTTAIVVRLMQKALVDGDTNSIRLLAELTGQISKNGSLTPEEERDLEYAKSLARLAINIPDNGRNPSRSTAIGPQAGPQTMFMCSPADIIIYGGAAGGGKTYALLLEMLRNKDVPGFGAVIFRHNYNQITAEGGLWDASNKLFSQVDDASPRKSPRLHWQFESGARLGFAHIEREEDLASWQGTEIAYIGFDELTHFSKHQFLYMLSRNRTTCGIKPYVRATCNPDSDSWVADFISWWIDQDTGYPIPQRSGIMRYMAVLNDTIYWGDTAEELEDLYGVTEDDCKTVTFIASRLDDNKILMQKDPGYLANLKAMTEVDMERLLYGNWKIRPKAGSFFKRTQLRKMLEEMPHDLVAVCRGWDLAATDEDENEDAAYTAGVCIGRTSEGQFVVLDVIRKQIKAGEVRTLIMMTAQMDKKKYGKKCPVRQRLPQDPGQAGKDQAQSFLKMLAGFDVQIKPESGDKATRAEPMAAQWQHGMFDIVEGEWNEEYLNELESFPDGKWKDMVDAGSSAFSELTLGMSNIAGGLVYNRLSEVFMSEDQSDNPYILKKDKLAEYKSQNALGEIHIGLVFGVNGSGNALVATTNLNYEAMIVLKSVLYSGESVDPETVTSRCIDFIRSIRDEYGYLTGVYCEKGEQVMRRNLKNALAEHDMGDIRVGAALDRNLGDRINTVNKLVANDRFYIVEDEAVSISTALMTATWDAKVSGGTLARSQESDQFSLNAFEYSFEGDMKKYVDNIS